MNTSLLAAQRLRRLARGDAASLSVSTSIPTSRDRIGNASPLDRIKEKADVLTVALKHLAGDKELDGAIQNLNKELSGAKKHLESLATMVVQKMADGDDGETLKQSAMQEVSDALKEASETLAEHEELATFLKSVQDQARKASGATPSAPAAGKKVQVTPKKPTPVQQNAPGLPASAPNADTGNTTSAPDAGTAAS